MRIVVGKRRWVMGSNKSQWRGCYLAYIRNLFPCKTLKTTKTLCATKIFSVKYYLNAAWGSRLFSDRCNIYINIYTPVVCIALTNPFVQSESPRSLRITWYKEHNSDNEYFRKWMARDQKNWNSFTLRFAALECYRSVTALFMKFPSGDWLRCKFTARKSSCRKRSTLLPVYSLVCYLWC